MRVRRSDWYGEYLNSDHWKRTRDMKLAAAGYRCERCGEWGRRAFNLLPTIGLHVHHLNYDHVGEELPTDLQVLCVPCHEETHGKPVDEARREQVRVEISRRIASWIASPITPEDLAVEIETWDKSINEADLGIVR